MPRQIIARAERLPNLPRRRRVRERLARAGLDAAKTPRRAQALRAIGAMKNYRVIGSALKLSIRGTIERATAVDIEARLAANPQAGQIDIEIDSPGGSVSAAQAIHNALRCAARRGVQVHACVVGKCCSAAVAVLLAADWREADVGSEFLLHSAALKPTGRERGTSEWHRRRARDLDETNSALVDQLVARTGGSRRQFEREFADETSMSLMRALSLGIVHAISGEAVWRAGKPYCYPR